MTSPTFTDPDLAAKTDLCVKCGLCLPHCPTYIKSRDENESPRGRLSLIQGWARSELKATPKLTSHIDTCLLCRACETVCPAYVPYGQIVDRFRGATQRADQSLATRTTAWTLRAILTGPRLAPLARHLLAGSGTATVSRAARLLGQGDLVAGLPGATATPRLAPGLYPATTAETRGQASLFLGCTSALLDADTVAAAVRVMNALGITVEIPDQQGCCGALHQHSGDSATATRYIADNLSAFRHETPSAAPAIVSFASGCGAMLKDYEQTLPGDASADFSRRVRDISQFINEIAGPEGFALQPLSATVCIHSPCSLKNVLRADRHAAVLLKQIPNLNVVSLPAQTRCCGAAGSYMLEHPDMAAELRDDVLDLIAASQASTLLTSNPGCAMHLRAGLAQRGLGHIEVIHPVTLLARQLPKIE
jgi:glycolate oxidase iron-sulfur subunit